MWFVKSRRAQSSDDHETWIEGVVAPTLNAFDNTGEVYATVISTIPAADRGSPNAEQAAGGQLIPEAAGVRRLTPVEVERLQGFPDDWTEGQSDRTRYVQCGNAVTVNVAEWLGRQLMEGLQ